MKQRWLIHIYQHTHTHTDRHTSTLPHTHTSILTHPHLHACTFPCPPPTPLQMHKHIHKPVYTQSHTPHTNIHTHKCATHPPPPSIQPHTQTNPTSHQYLRSSMSRALLSPEISFCSSGAQNMHSQSGCTTALKPRMKASAWSLICRNMRKWAIRWT